MAAPIDRCQAKSDREIFDLDQANCRSRADNRLHPMQPIRASGRSNATDKFSGLHIEPVIDATLARVPYARDATWQSLPLA